MGTPDSPRISQSTAMFALLALSTARAGALAAQHEHPTTDSVAVTELAPITVVGARERAVAPPVETIEVSAEQLRQAPASGPYDLVRRTAGIEVHEQGQGPGFASDAVIRGFTSDHSSDVLLVIDGVPINLPLHGHVEGYADWSLLTPAAIASLRVIHGPSSPLYGDFAFGGVVEAVTADDATGSAGAVRGSSYGDAGGWFRTGRRGATTGAFVAVDGERQQGWRDNADYWLGNVVAHGWRRAGAGRLTGGAMLYGSTWNSPGFVSVQRFNDDQLEAATDPTDGGTAGRLILHGHYNRPLGDVTGLESALWMQGVRSEVFLNIPHDGLVAQTEEEDRRVAVGGEARVSWRPGAGEVTTGLSGRADWTRYELFDTEARVQESQDQGNDGRYQSGGAFVRWRGLLAQRIAFDLGGRLDLLNYSSLDRLTPGAAWRDETRLLASPKLGARYLLGDRISLLASFSRGFRGAVGVIGDPSRPPVVAWAKEVGASYQGDRVEGRLALFRFDVSNERIQDPVTREVSAAGESRRQGVSLELSLTPVSSVRVTAEGTWNDAKITGIAADTSEVRVPALAVVSGEVPMPRLHDEPLTPGARVPGVARWSGRAAVEAGLTGTIQSRTTFRFSGPFTPIGEPGIRTKAYALVDLGGSIRLTRSGPTLDLDLLNLLNTRYPELRASGFINPGAPRALRIAFRFGGHTE
jgi:outer membrane receptor protein involved in Fe transport